MSTSVITTRTELILRWPREHLLAAKQGVTLKRVAESLRCQGLAACIIATIWPPEPLRTFTSRIEMNCGRAAPAWQSLPTQLSLHVGSWSLSRGSSVQKTLPIQPHSSKLCRRCARTAFWRAPYHRLSLSLALCTFTTSLAYPVADPRRVKLQRLHAASILILISILFTFAPMTAAGAQVELLYAADKPQVVFASSEIRAALTARGDACILHLLDALGTPWKGSAYLTAGEHNLRLIR